MFLFDLEINSSKPSIISGTFPFLISEITSSDDSDVNFLSISSSNTYRKSAAFLFFDNSVKIGAKLSVQLSAIILISSYDVQVFPYPAAASKIINCAPGF